MYWEDYYGEEAKYPEVEELLKTKDYDFLRISDKLKDRLIFLTIGGSHAYGTNTGTSDVDIRGCCFNSKTDLLGLSNFEQFVDENTDTVIYSVNKLFPLLINCNPNTIELLGNKLDRYFYLNSIGSLLLGNKNLFLSRRCINSFGGYALAQLNRLTNALGKNNNEEGLLENLQRSLQSNLISMNTRYNDFEQGSIQYSINNNELVCNVNLKDFPLNQFNSILNEQANILKTYHKLNHRNNKKDDNHLCKHAMHLVRLYQMGIDILEKEEINTYREGKDHDILMSIRKGDFLKDEVFTEDFYTLLKEYQDKFEYAKNNTSLPANPDMKKIEELLMFINESGLRN